MLWYRQVATVVWAFLGFMVVAALVLHLRYKPLSGHEVYLDTWTGKLRSVAALEHTTSVPALDVSAAASAKRALEIAVLDELAGRGPRSGSCAAVRFAFPAPGH